MPNLFDKEFRPEGEKVFRVRVDQSARGISLSVGRGVTLGTVQAMHELTKMEAKALCHALLEATKD